jgi:hypothetical protein
VAVSLLALLGVAALVIDIGFALVAKQQLQNVADAAALGGARQLGRSYESLGGQGGGALPQAGRDRVTAVVNDIVQKNDAANRSGGGTRADIRIGQWIAAGRTLAPPRQNPDAVRVIARREIVPFFGGVVGVRRIPLSATATAALTPLGQVAPGTLVVPVGLSQSWFQGGATEERRVTLFPAAGRETCVGWSTFTETPATVTRLQTVLRGLTAGGYASPGAIGGRTQFQLMRDDPDGAAAELRALYDAKKNPRTGEWTTLVSVYGRAACPPPAQPATIAGFATARITEVMAQGRWSLEARISNGSVQSGRGGGTDFGTKGSIPGLVQ